MYLPSVCVCVQNSMRAIQLWNQTVNRQYSQSASIHVFPTLTRNGRESSGSQSLRGSKSTKTIQTRHWVRAVQVYSRSAIEKDTIRNQVGQHLNSCKKMFKKNHVHPVINSCFMKESLRSTLWCSNTARLCDAGSSSQKSCNLQRHNDGQVPQWPAC